MSAKMKVGFSMHPRWLGAGSLEAFVAPLRQVGLEALEFELDNQQAFWPEFGPLMESAVKLGLDLSFHAPFRKPHTLKGFSTSQRSIIQNEYAPMLEIAESWGERLDSPRTVVIHAATAHIPVDRDSLEADTLAFLEWGLDTFQHIRFALENNSPASEEIKIGENLSGVLAILEKLGSERLGACWDMGHDYLVRGEAAPPPEWLAVVSHVHVHDVNHFREDHYPLIFGRVPYPVWLPSLPANRRPGIAVLELKGGHLKDWSSEKINEVLIQSIAMVAQGVC